MMQGLTTLEARARLAEFGPNTLPEARPPSFAAVFLRQFLSPLIYILVAAAAVAMTIGDAKDAAFIGVVLIVNGIIGAVQEYSAGQAAAALRQKDQPHALVLRDGVQQEIDARDLVPSDIVFLEAGRRVPADMRLIETVDLRCDESLLTGESLPVKKRAAADVKPAPRDGMAFAGSMVIRGRGVGEATATGRATEVGKIAGELIKPSASQPPLIIRMERFSKLIAILVAVAVAILMIVGYLRHIGLVDLFMMAVGLAVSAIPEGLPVAIAVALAIGMRRMAKANVIVRKMAAVESLGSCTLIATDKTGTLTRNELTVTEIVLADGSALSLQPDEGVESYCFRGVAPNEQADLLLAALLRAAALPNEAEIRREREEVRGVGDTVDVALLVAAHRSGVGHEELRARYPLVKRIPYEPDLKYAASFHLHEEKDAVRVFVKGAPETLIAMAGRMDVGGALAPIDRDALSRQKDALSARGLRVLAFAEGEIAPEPDHGYGPRHLENLVFLGLVGMHDPLRPDVRRAIGACHDAGVVVTMVTGDAPGTAAAIAKEAGMAFSPDQIVTGDAVKRAEEAGESALDALTRRARIYARVEPIQKLAIVLSLTRNGHFVAVTGDGVNDAPALKHAHVGVAMGKQGTDVAKESADIIIADDNFASIVRGVFEGRVAYANIRKVIFLLVSTGAAELLLFLLAIPAGMPMPLLPVQLLWLNLVTNGVQHVALAAEKPEGDELTYPPRKPEEPIFDRVMITRNAYSALVMAGVGFGLFYWLIAQGADADHARNLLLLLFVIFENFQALNARSERHSLFHRGLFSSPLLVASVFGAQALHLAASHVPGLADTLRIWPPTVAEWGALLAAGSSLLLVMELEKWWTERHKRPKSRRGPAAVTVASARLGRYAAVAASAALFVTAVVGGALYWRTIRQGAPHEFATVERGEIVGVAEVAGVVVSAPPAEAAAPVAGKIEAVACNNGERVEAGRVCARIIPPDRQAEIDRARRALSVAQAAQRKSATAVDRAARARPSAAIARAKARLAQAQTVTVQREAALRAAQEKGAPVIAPIGGTIGESRLETRRATHVGERLFQVTPAERTLRIEAVAPDAGAPPPLGAPATVSFTRDPSQRVKGEVLATLQGKDGPRIVIETRTLPSSAQPGATALLHIELDRRKDVLRVPRHALQYAPAGSASLEPPPAGWARVWAWRNGVAVPVVIQPGLDDGVFVEIKAGAIDAGDQVVVNGGGLASQTL
ncbi:HAD-IC family P-type ATPase [Methylocystis echinoides]|uniref:HAD-IC family P-type ATPase n=1 Tax=Methylocystis echinoides TaxID=29468 RepID=UPI003862152A